MIKAVRYAGQGTLDENWHVAARAALERAESAARDLTAARAENQQARSAVVAMVRSVTRPPLADAELGTLAAARAAYDDFAELPVGDDLALAEHVDATLPPLRAAYAELAQEASDLIQAREDAWSPVAFQLADWLNRAETAAAVDYPMGSSHRSAEVVAGQRRSATQRTACTADREVSSNLGGTAPGKQCRPWRDPA